MSFNLVIKSANKAVTYINELEELAKNLDEKASDITFDENDDRIIKAQFFYIKEQFILKNIYEELLKTIQEELNVMKITEGNGHNAEGILQSIQDWKNVIQIAKHKALLSKTRM